MSDNDYPRQSELHEFVKLMQMIGCRYGIGKTKQDWFVGDDEAPKGIEYCVSISQAHFHFDGEGKFLGVLADEMGYWSLRLEREAKDEHNH